MAQTIRPVTGKICGKGNEPLARQTIFRGFRKAAIEKWGEAGLEQIRALMPEDCREEGATVKLLAYDWLPERFVMNWYEAAMKGPAQNDEKVYRQFIHGMMRAGFGTVRRLVLNLVSPQTIAKKMEELWGYDHNTGELVLTNNDPGKMVFRLKDHLYASTILSRTSIAAVFNAGASLTRARPPVTDKHRLEANGDLILDITYGAPPAE